MRRNARLGFVQDNQSFLTLSALTQNDNYRDPIGQGQKQAEGIKLGLDVGIAIHGPEAALTGDAPSVPRQISCNQ
jgi:hypothetical protein